MKQKLIVSFLGLLLAAGWVSCSREEKVPEKAAAVVRDVKVEALHASEVDEVYEAVGTVRSKVTSVVSSRATGNILAVHFREGDRVKAGQLLVEIDDREAAARLRRVQAGLLEAEGAVPELERSIKAAEAGRAASAADKTLADSTFHRYEVLFGRGSVSRQEFEESQARSRSRDAEFQRAEETLQALRARREQLQARVEQARAEVSHAQLSAGYNRVLSPLNGRVIAKQAEVGMLAESGVPLLTIEDDGRYRLEALVEESKIGKIRLGEAVRVRIGETEWSGKVGEIGPSADPASRSAIVKIDLIKAGGKESARTLRSGIFGKAAFRTGSRKSLLIPKKALIRRGQLEEVFILDTANLARLRLIKTGESLGDRMEVLSGLREGEWIITDGLERVTDGIKVEPQNHEKGTR